MIILIDNDKIIQLSWRMRASKTGKKIECYFTIDDFLNNLPSFDVTIYIDSNLGENIKGEVEAQKLYNMGFTNVYLTTGFSDIRIEEYPWLKGKISKSPPF